ncbi:ABC transporter permease [Anaerolineales bacterium]
MTKHILRRIIQAIPTLFGVTLLSFMIMSAAPGNAALFQSFGVDPRTATPETIERLSKQMGLNDPWPIQYLKWLVGDDWMWWKNYDEEGNAIERNHMTYGMLRLDFGKSFRNKESAVKLIAERIPATIELGVTSLIVGLVLGIPIGILAAVYRGGVFDNFSRIFAVLGNSIPNFWLGLILLLIFAFNLGILPSGHRCDPVKYSRSVCPPIYERLEYLILPTIVLAMGGIAGTSRFMRTSMLDTVNSDYVRTAKAKGLSPRVIWFKHAARNAMIPIATGLGPAIVGILGGAVITEQIFSWPGIGLLTIRAINSQDYNIVMATTFIFAILTIFGYILSDIFYALFDPRIRF